MDHEIIPESNTNRPHCIICLTSTPPTPPASSKHTHFFLTSLLPYPLLSPSQISALPEQHIKFCPECAEQLSTASSAHAQIQHLTAALLSLRSIIQDKILATLSSGEEQDFYGEEVRRRVRQESFTITPEVEIKEEDDFLGEQCTGRGRARCPRTFPSALTAHNPSNSFTCLVCGMTFGRKDYFMVHRDCHSDYPEEGEQGEVGGVQKPHHENGQVMESESESESEGSVWSGTSGEEDDDFSPRSKPRPSQKTSSHPKPRPLKRPLKPPPPLKPPKSCPICSLAFHSYPKMIHHLNAQHETKPGFFCKVCEKGFLRQDYLESHMRGSHGETSTPANPATDAAQEKLSERTCPVCYKVFERPSMMSSHHTHVHDTSSPGFICEICAKKFKRRDTLKKHLEFHSAGVDGGKVFKCDACDKGFRRKRDMEVHMRLHTGVKELLCSLCGQSFRHEWSFRRHNILLHGLRPSKKYECSVCGKVFKIKWHLDQHLKSKSHGGGGLGVRVRRRNKQQKQQQPTDSAGGEGRGTCQFSNNNNWWGYAGGSAFFGGGGGGAG